MNKYLVTRNKWGKLEISYKVDEKTALYIIHAKSYEDALDMVKWLKLSDRAPIDPDEPLYI